MGRHVDGHAVHFDGEIGAVIKIEAAQEILVGLTLSGMLGDNQAGHDLKRLAGPQEGHGIHLGAADAHGAGGSRLQRSGSVGRCAGRDPAGACGGLVRSGRSRATCATILRWLGPGYPLGRPGLWRSDYYWRKLASTGFRSLGLCQRRRNHHHAGYTGQPPAPGNPAQRPCSAR